MRKRSNANFVVPYLKKGSTFDEEEVSVIRSILQNKETLACGVEREAFEREFADFLGIKYAFSLTNCTVALEFATHLIRLEDGDEVIATPFSYQATVQPLLDKNVTVKFCDIDPNSLCADVGSIEKLITPKTKAVYITHYGGHMVDMDPLMELANKHAFIVVEDCAHSLGTSYKGKKSGSTAHISCFSFHSMKNISTLGEGGMIAFNNDQWAKVIYNIRRNEPDAIFASRNVLFGPYSLEPYEFYTHEKNAFTEDCLKIMHRGTNANLSEVCAAVGRVQLKKLKNFNRCRQNIASYLDNKLSQVEELRLQQVPGHITHSYHLYTVFIHPEFNIDRNALAEYLNQNGVEIVLRYFPIHLLPEWRLKGGKYGQCPTTEYIWFTELLNLPIYPALIESQLDYTVEKIIQGLEHCRQRKVSYS
ncbi:MAG: DegT/DnrJ/EryC1/StrS family aminotransferase [Alphaproteobacteria bacterium]|nr:DegT/DnrJ/EryC1/StrS family aminotransferase [Alphaproteobacteria bacterium]MBY0501891.1 DegT/DnrJ/EryC1/StrS family aminotransferase [Alphaproteobacteria bacterium]